MVSQRLPKIKTHKSLFANKVNMKIHKEIERIWKLAGKEEVPKWAIIEKALIKGLKLDDEVKTKHNLDEFFKG